MSGWRDAVIVIFVTPLLWLKEGERLLLLYFFDNIYTGHNFKQIKNFVYIM